MLLKKVYHVFIFQQSIYYSIFYCMRKFLILVLFFSCFYILSAQMSYTRAKIDISAQGTTSAVTLKSEQLLSSYNAIQHVFNFKAKSDVFYVNADANQQKVNQEVFGAAVKVFWNITVDASTWNGADVTGLLLPVTISYNGHQTSVTAPVTISTVNQKTTFSAEIPLNITSLGLSLGNNGDIFANNVTMIISDCSL